MSALLYRRGTAWVLETKLSSSYHANSRHSFSTARDARAFAKRFGISVRRASGCDSPGD